MQTPTELTTILMQKSAEFGHLSDELADILEIKASKWIELRESQKSDTATERTWQATPEGLRETRIKIALKKLEKQMSAIKTHLRTLSDEAHNLY